MNTEDLIEFIHCNQEPDGSYKVMARERSDLEFRETCNQNDIRESVRTIAAFSNTIGGSIVFGVTNRARSVCGIDVALIPDEADIRNILSDHLSLAPDIEIIEHEIGGMLVIEIAVEKSIKPPVTATRSLRTADRGIKNILQQGVIYYRRAGKSRPITGEECIALLGVMLE